MNRILITSALLGLGMGTDIFADHTSSSIRRDYEIRRVELANDYRARREANVYAYHRERDILHAERARAFRLECSDARAFRVRAINRELGTLSRDFAVRNRDLARWYHREREVLRDNRELALRNTRLVRPVVVERPVIGDRVHRHPADCECSVCSPPSSVVPSAPVRSNEFGLHGARGYDGYSGEPTRSRHNRRGIDWASLLLTMLMKS